MKFVDNDIVLHTRNLSVGYSGKKEAQPVLSHLDLFLKKGMLVSFMGPNGIGKTTLLRTLSGLMQPLDGEIFIRKQNILSYSLNDLARILSVVLTDPVQAGNLTVQDMVSMGRYPYTNWFLKFSKEDLLKVNEAINLVQLNELRWKKIYELSDGQLQKVLIARALAQDGEIMILDEPNSHLDLNNRIEIMRILRRLCRITGKTILVATHELDLALQTSDWLWLATNEGKVIDGMPEDLVLNDSFDNVFTTKGFDLKTGRIVHDEAKIGKVNLSGSGFLYLWTKNALERNGFEVADDEAPVQITIDEQSPKWIIVSSEKEENTSSIQSLLERLGNHL